MGAVPGEFTVEVLAPEPGVRVSSLGWSFDGTYLAVTRSRDGEFEVVIWSPGSGEVTVLPGLLGVVPSPSELVFLSARLKDDGNAERVFVEFDGGAERPAPSGLGAALAWSPDGDRWATLFSTDGGDPHELRIIELASGMVTEVPLQLADGTPLDLLWISWSPDGRLIAFAADDPTELGYSRIFGVDVVEHEVVMWTNESFYGFDAPTWSTDGTGLAAAPAWVFDTIYLTDYAVVIFADSGQSIVERVPAATELAWAPDGRRAVTMLSDAVDLQRTHIVVSQDGAEWRSSDSDSRHSDSVARWRPVLP